MALVDDYVVVVDLAAANDGLVTRPQLLAEGVSPTSIARLTRTPRALSSLGAGVYLVPALEDMRFGPFKVALQRLSPERFLSQIAGDPLGERGGVLSHHAAAELHGALDLPQEMARDRAPSAPCGRHDAAYRDAGTGRRRHGRGHAGDERRAHDV